MCCQWCLQLHQMVLNNSNTDNEKLHVFCLPPTRSFLILSHSAPLSSLDFRFLFSCIRVRIRGHAHLLLHGLAQSPVNVLGEEIVEPAETHTQVSWGVETLNGTRVSHWVVVIRRIGSESVGKQKPDHFPGFLSPGSAPELDAGAAHGGSAAGAADIGSAGWVTADGHGGADRQLTDIELEGAAVSAAWGTGGLSELNFDLRLIQERLKGKITAWSSLKCLAAPLNFAGVYVCVCYLHSAEVLDPPVALQVDKGVADG